MNFLKIYDQYYERIRKFILAITKDEGAADDLLQETFLRIEKNMDKVREPEKMSSWIFQIAYNLCQDHIKSRQKSTICDPEVTSPAFEIPLIKKIEQQQMGDCVQEKMNLLPEPSRIILILFDIMEFTHKEIAGILSISVDNSKVRLHRARKELKSILKKECTFQYDKRNVLICEPVDRDCRKK